MEAGRGEVGEGRGRGGDKGSWEGVGRKNKVEAMVNLILDLYPVPPIFSTCSSLLPNTSGNDKTPWPGWLRGTWLALFPRSPKSHPTALQRTLPGLVLTTRCTGGKVFSMLSGASRGDMKGFLTMGDE